ncbi:MAG TPA: tetratricopeptide repeat protein, partial [Herpetosiphonaceae bacterium]
AAFPGEALWFRRRAEADGALKQPALALADWRQTTALSPTDDLAWYQQGVAAAESGDPAAGAAAMEQAIALNPQPITYHLTLGGTYLVLGRRDEARAAYERAALLEPDNPVARDLLRQLQP